MSSDGDVLAEIGFLATVKQQEPGIAPQDTGGYSPLQANRDIHSCASTLIVFSKRH